MHVASDDVTPGTKSARRKEKEREPGENSLGLDRYALRASRDTSHLSRRCLFLGENGVGMRQEPRETTYAQVDFFLGRARDLRESSRN